VANKHWKNEAKAAVTQGIQARLGDNVQVEIRLVDSIAPEASGKYRYVVSHVPLQGGLEMARFPGEKTGSSSPSEPAEAP